MSTFILGVNAAYHDSSAALIEDNQIIAAAEEERFTRVKHGKRPNAYTTHELPFHAIDYCLREAGIYLDQVRHIAYSFDPSLLPAHLIPPEGFHLAPHQPDWARLSLFSHPAFSSSIWNAPLLLHKLVPHHLRERLELKDKDNPPYQWHFVPHHLAHAASSFFPSPFSQAAILTMDGVGESVTSMGGYGEGTHIQVISQVLFPNSLGMLYERITACLGFIPSSDEGKVMAMASLGRPRFLDVFQKVICFNQDGTFTTRSFDFEQIFGKARKPTEPLQQVHYDIAASLQKALEAVVVQLASWLHRATGSTMLCMAGGVALNCVMNSRVRAETPFKEIFIQPAAGDAGTALGAALWVSSQLGYPRPPSMAHAYLGPGYADDSIEAELKRWKLGYRTVGNIVREVAGLLARQKIVGWFQGRMEFGPRALGARSILASPTDAEMTQRLNRLKGREFFRPVAPVVLEEQMHRYFVGAATCPFMLFTFDLIPEMRSIIPAAEHVDGTARIQTVNESQSPRLYELLKAFGDLTGIYVLINTSFNTQREPIVCTPEDALRTFYASELDALAIGNFLILK